MFYELAAILYRFHLPRPSEIGCFPDSDILSSAPLGFCRSKLSLL